MKKFFFSFVLIAVFFVSCSVQAQDHRSDYRFESTLADPDSDGYFHSIKVNGYVANEKEPMFECEHELWGFVDANDAEGTTWIYDWDINFDGTPDLVIFLWRNVAGRVSEYYAAYTWNTKQNYFAQVDGFEEIANPELDPDTKTITSWERTGINEFTRQTYAWQKGKLVLIKETQGKIYEDEE